MSGFSGSRTDTRKISTCTWSETRLAMPYNKHGDAVADTTKAMSWFPEDETEIERPKKTRNWKRKNERDGLARKRATSTELAGEET